MKILLHACCGPCSLEPVRLLHEQGHELTIAYANSNIFPPDEYEHRLQELISWAQTQGIPVVEDTYDPKMWEAVAGQFGMSADTRPDRCRACYKLRLRRLAKLAAEQGFEGIASTLTVSPYQYTDIIGEELAAAAQEYGLASVFEDFRPYYEAAAQKSRDLGMYRQNYCGCRFSKAEAALERKERKEERKRQQELRRQETAEQRAQEEAERERKRAERAAYNKKQAAKHAILKKLREEAKAQDALL